MANGLVNVEGITNKEVEELAQILNELNELIGGEANTGGTATAGTVMAKLNRLLTDLTTTRAGYLDTINTNAARLTNERATKLDNIGATNNTGGTASAGTVMGKLNKLLTDWTTTRAGYLDTINTNIGATGNTGGTTSAGTVMAKLNKLLTDWTAARAGKIDTINNAIGTTGNTGGTATAGTVMAKLNQLLNNDATQYKVSNTVRHTITKNQEAATSHVFIGFKKIYQFHAKYDGCINVYSTVDIRTVACELYVMRSLHDYVNFSGQHTTMTNPKIYTSAIDTIFKDFNRMTLNINDYSRSGRNSNLLYWEEYENLILGSNVWSEIGNSPSFNTVLMDTVIPVKKGEEIVFLSSRYYHDNSAANNTDTAKITLQIKYDEVKV